MADAFEGGLNRTLPVAPWMAPHTSRLPGTVPISPADWLFRDEVFAVRIALRDRLIAERPDAVHACAPTAGPAADELLAHVIARLSDDPGYRVAPREVERPDGVRVARDGPPLLQAGRVVEEDLVILERPDGAAEHVLTGAVLCFPSNWTLEEKFGRPLMAIHAPVPSYDPGIGLRVQRLFDGLRAGTPLMRANILRCDLARLHSPRREDGRRRPAGRARYLRVERQVLLRLPETRAVVFSIHTFVVTPASLPMDRRRALEAARPGQFATGLEE